MVKVLRSLSDMCRVTINTVRVSMKQAATEHTWQVFVVDRQFLTCRCPQYECRVRALWQGPPAVLKTCP